MLLLWPKCCLSCFLKILGGMANSVDSYQSSLIWDCCTVCKCHFPGNCGVRNFRTFTVSEKIPVKTVEGKQAKKVRKKSRECHNHKPEPFPDPKRTRKPTNPNKHKPNKRTKSTKISSLFPKRGNRNTKRTEKHKNKMTHGKTYNKSPRRINHKAAKSKTNTGTTALERSVEQTTGGFKAFLQLAYFTLGPDATLNT